MRRLRAVRRGCACGCAVPVVLSRRNCAQSDLARPPEALAASEDHRLAWRLWRGGPGMRAPRPVNILIAAPCGGSGGGRRGWVVAAAVQAGFPVQSTSIPGVAQRTGATTYYIEILSVPSRDLGSKRPV